MKTVNQAVVLVSLGLAALFVLSTSQAGLIDGNADELCGETHQCTIKADGSTQVLDTMPATTSESTVQGGFNTPFELLIDGQTDTSRPFAAGDYTPNGSFTMRTIDGDCAGTYTVNATPVANSAPDGTTPPSTTVVTYIGFPQGTFFFGNAGVGDYLVTATNTSETCNFDAEDNPLEMTVTVGQTFDTPFAVSVFSQADTSLPFNDPSYAPDGEFTMEVVDGSCDGTYTVSAQPVAASGPEGSTPPSTNVVTYVGFGEGTFLFTPAGIGDYQVTVTQTGDCFFDAGVNPAEQTVTISGAVPVLTLSQDFIDFGDQSINTTSPTSSVTLSNTGTGDLLVSAVSVPAAPFAEAGGTCGSAPITIPEAGSCTLAYEFSPTTTGTAVDQIMLESTSTTSPDSIDLEGFGTEVLAVLDSTALDFGMIDVGTSSVEVITVTSNGNADLIISNMTDPGFPFSLTGGTCLAVPVTLANGDSCTIEVTFDPSGSFGSFMSSFDIVSNAVSSPDAVSVQGAVLNPIPVPTMSLAGLLTLMLTLMLFGAAVLRRNAG